MTLAKISACIVPHECIDRQRCLYHCQDTVMLVLGEDGEYFWAVVTPGEEVSEVVLDEAAHIKALLPTPDLDSD